jgi:hypothetical protein
MESGASGLKTASMVIRAFGTAISASCLFPANKLAGYRRGVPPGLRPTKNQSIKAANLKSQIPNPKSQISNPKSQIPKSTSPNRPIAQPSNRPINHDFPD